MNINKAKIRLEHSNSDVSERTVQTRKPPKLDLKSAILANKAPQNLSDR